MLEAYLIREWILLNISVKFNYRKFAWLFLLSTSLILTSMGF